METFMSIVAMIVIPVAVVYILKKRRRDEAALNEKVKSMDNGELENKLSVVTPYVKQAMTKYSVRNASELRRLRPNELMEILKRASAVLVVFEDRISEILGTFEQIDGTINDFWTMGGLAKNRNAEQNLKSAKEQLERQLDQAMTAFDIEGTLEVIPKQYRISLILDTLHDYLSDGEAGSWEDCIRIFKDDMQKMQQNEHFNTIISQLSSIDRNTKAAAFFSGVTAMNTTKIASRF